MPNCSIANEAAAQPQTAAPGPVVAERAGIEQGANDVHRATGRSAPECPDGADQSAAFVLEDSTRVTPLENEDRWSQ